MEEEGSYADFYGTRAQAMSAAEGAIRQIGLKGANELTQRDRELMGHYEQLKRKFSAMPDSTRGWLTNKNWVITTPMETGIAPRATRATAPGQDPPGECRRVRALSVRGRQTGDDDHLDRRAGGFRRQLRAH